ncbi:MARVEL domain-containing protein [Histoplasma capsulatum G186AR]|nr:MARVEL domain-containing protein [Histoplasma capsulatum]QSS68608.1 MARVEL domain-containing protein [Histoplasma capsulatum G186AR]
MTHSNSSGDRSDQYEPVSPVDIINPRRSKNAGPMSVPKDPNEKPSGPAAPALKSPRTARFAEVTTFHSPIDPPGKSPFADPPSMSQTNQQTQVSDLGFGYMADNQPDHVTEQPQTAAGRNPPNSPLKSALKSPGAPARSVLLSPTFREEQILEHHERDTEKANAKDVKIKTRVRLAKVLLRGVSFSCSLIVLALVASTFSIFNATRGLAQKNSFTPWAPNTPVWPQILVLCIAAVSLLFSIGVLYGYCRGGHKRAEKVAVYYTVFSVMVFIVTLVMWVVGAAVLQNSRNSSSNKDIWGWACNPGTRRDIYQDQVDYELICRMQDWSLVCCVIEVVIEVLVIGIYAVVFYRFYSKRKLRKSMDMRDKARSDLYLAHLRSQSAPNTPGFSKYHPGSPPMSPALKKGDNYASAEEGYSTQYANPQTPESTYVGTPRPFQLRPPPIRVQDATPKISQDGFNIPMSPATIERRNEHVDAAPGEQKYESVPIPGSYAMPLTSPSFAPETRGSDVIPGMAVTAAERIVPSRNS